MKSKATKIPAAFTGNVISLRNRSATQSLPLGGEGGSSEPDEVAPFESEFCIIEAETLIFCRNNCKFAMGDTSSVCSADSFPSRGSLLTSASS